MVRETNYLGGALLFSAFWHVMWLSLIGIVAGPDIKAQEKFTEVSFLGPILEKTAFEMMVEESHPKSETLYRTSMIVKSEAHLDVKGPDRSVKKNAISELAKGETYLKDEKYASNKNPAPYFIKGKSIFYHIGEKGLNKFIEGPAKRRTIISKPPLPHFPKVSFVAEENFVLKFKFILSNDGNIEFLEPVVSSGYPKIDMQCAKYIKLWKFEPMGEDNEEKEWGIITLNIKGH